MDTFVIGMKCSLHARFADYETRNKAVVNTHRACSHLSHNVLSSSKYLIHHQSEDSRAH